jgi:hypothetical protein
VHLKERMQDAVAGAPDHAPAEIPEQAVQMTLEESEPQAPSH